MTDHDFQDASLEEALDRALEAAPHLAPIHAATVRAARDLARKIDAWSVIVDWALDDATDGDGNTSRPAVPANDNVSLASFLKYMNDLGLTPQLAPKTAGKPAASAEPPKNELEEMRQRLQQGKVGA